MGFVVGYAPCGLSPQIDGMPVIHEKNFRDFLPKVLILGAVTGGAKSTEVKVLFITATPL